MTKTKHSDLPPAAEFGKDREVEFPRCIITGWMDIRGWKETDCWQFNVGLVYKSARVRFTTWCIRGFTQEQKDRTVYALRQRAAGEGVARIEIYRSSPPPTLAQVLEIERFNKVLCADSAWLKNRDEMRKRRAAAEADKKRVIG
jgi:hypothetical protein